MTTKQEKQAERVQAAYEMRIICGTAKMLVQRMERVPSCLSLQPEIKVMVRALSKQAEYFAELSKEVEHAFRKLDVHERD